MKKAIVFAALTLLSASAFASKARVAAMGTAVTAADDVQEVFRNPAEMFGFGDMLTIEYRGGSAANEGGFFRSNGDTKYGIYFGHRSVLFNAMAAGAGILGEQNPFEVFYGSKMGDAAWAISFFYSNGNDKVAKNKVNSMGLRAGYNTDAFEVYANLGLAAKSEVDAGNVVSGDGGVTLGGEYFMGDSIVYAELSTGGVKVGPSGAEVKTTAQLITVGYETKVKGEGSHFYYGVRLENSEQKTDPSKTTSMKLPLYAGVEADAASWLALRGYIQQSVLLNASKVDPGGGAAATTDTDGLNDNAVGAGASLKFGKLSLDGTLSVHAAGGGTLNTDTLLASTSLNYWF